MLNRFNLTFLFVLSALMVRAQQSPVEGQDLLNCLGQPRNSELVSKLNNFIGNKDTKEEISFLNYGKGIQVNIQKSIVTSIDLYNDANPYSTEFKRFPGKLPLNMDFDMSIYKAKQAMGEGFETTGEVEATFQLIKVFRLNENDDYRMTAEFNVGRMIMMSLAYIEGGAGSSDSTGATKAENGFTGNDFFTMMNKNKFNLEFTRLCALLHPNPTYENRTRRLYVDDGVDVVFKDGAINKIMLYSGGQHCDYKEKTFGPYLFDLPYGMRMENTRTAIIKKLGTPASESGDMITYKERITNFNIAFKGDKIDYVSFELNKTKEPVLIEKSKQPSSSE